ncbi:MAG: LytR/AlgR family response regulator transcription factor [Flavipsychrobacter sp.]
MKPLAILIVDDEPLARDILETYLQKVPDVQLAGTCKNALEAFSFLSKQQVDVMLLDINMPEISGMDFLKTLKNPPAIIFTTAYSQYAVESYELNAVDYLLKPISFERFLKAITKAIDTIKQKNTAFVESSVNSLNAKDDILFVKSDGKLVKIDLTQLWFVEGLKDYVRLWTDSGKVIVHSTMKNFEEQLSALAGFVRVSKSYIINMKYVSEVDGNVIRIKDQMISIGNTYKEQIQELFNKYKMS